MKTRTTIYIEQDTYERAKKTGVSISFICEKALMDFISKSEGRIDNLITAPRSADPGSDPGRQDPQGALTDDQKKELSEFIQTNKDIPNKEAYDRIITKTLKSRGKTDKEIDLFIKSLRDYQQICLFSQSPGT
jgi:hypothetical protein